MSRPSREVVVGNDVSLWRLLRQKQVLSAFALLLASGLVTIITSCADADNDDVGAPDAAVDRTPVEDARPPEPAPFDGGCDASDEDCVTHALSCAEAPWCPVATGVPGFYALTAVWGSSKNDVWATGSGGTVIHWDGAAWVTTPVGVANTFSAVWGSGPNDVWIASATDTVFHTTGYANTTTSWTRVKMPVEEDTQVPLHTIWGSGTSDLRIAGKAFTIFDDAGNGTPGNTIVGTKLGDGGVSFEPLTGTSTVLGQWGSSANDVWLVGDNSLVSPWQLGLSLHGTGTDGGAFNWTEVDTQSSVRLRAIWGSSPDDLWTVGDIGTVRHVSSATSKQWTVVSSPTRETLRALWGAAANDIWAVGDSGTILHFDGAGWTKVLAAFPIGKKPTLYGVWGSARDDVWIVGDSIALHYTGGDLGDGGFQ